jgi:hypothetical protein
MSDNLATEPKADDGEPEFLWGATRIGDAIGQNPNVTFRLLQEGKLPARKVGKRWVSEGKMLQRHVMPAA